MDNKIKIEFFPATADDVLEALAAMLKRTAAGTDPKLMERLRRFHKISLKIKKQPAGVRVRVKVEGTADEMQSFSPVQPSTETAPTGEAGYKQVKKRLQELFAGVGKALAKDKCPPTGEMTEFLDLAERMMSYAGRGDAHYPVFRAACRRLAEAVDRSDPVAARACFAELKRQKTACHHRYKT
jgi:XXXCH domain-containing protein